MLGGVGFIIPSRHCLVQESISGAWVLFSRGGVDLLSLCIPLGLWDSAVPKGEPQLSLPPLAQLQGKGVPLDSAR